MADDFLLLNSAKPHRVSSASSRIANFFPKLLSGAKDDNLSVTTSSAKLSQSPLKAIRSEGNFSSFLTKRKAEHKSPAKNAMPQPTLSNSNLKDEDYLCQAAQFFSTAQKSEVEGHYHLAFSCYKAGVNQLLRGVQHEQDITRRNAVRKRTAKYLQKADRIYRYYVAGDLTDEGADHWKAENDLAIQDPEVIGFQGHASELTDFSFKRCLAPRVHLVQDKNSLEEYVLKIMPKTCYPERQYLRITKVPAHVPGVAPLLKYYDTQDSIILLLSHVRSGLLWRKLRRFFEMRRRLLNLDNRSADPNDPVPLDQILTVQVEAPPKIRVGPMHSLGSIDSGGELSPFTPVVTLESPTSQDGGFESILSSLNVSSAIAQFSIGSTDEEDAELAEMCESAFLTSATASAFQHRQYRRGGRRTGRDVRVGLPDFRYCERCRERVCDSAGGAAEPG